MLKGVVVTYSALVCVWFLASRIWPDSGWAMILLDKIAGHVLIAAPPLLVVSLLCRSRLAAFSAAASLAVFVHFYYPFLVPRRVPAGHERDLRIMTYNIWNQNDELGRVVSVIRDPRPDVVSLQEVTDERGPELIEALSGEFPWYRLGRATYGGTVAIFSKLEIESLEEIDLGIDRPALVATVRVDGRPVIVVAGHLYPSYYAYHDRPWSEMPSAIEGYIRRQRAQVSTLVGALEGFGDRPIVFACDCNVQETASTIGDLEAFFRDSAKSVGWQYGSTGESGLSFEHDPWHIDYIWYRGELTPTRVLRSKDDGGSDHRPIVADFVFAEE